MELPMDGSAGSTARLERRVKSKRCKRGTSHGSSKGAQNEADGELQKVPMVSSERMARGAGCWGATQSCGGGTEMASKPSIGGSGGGWAAGRCSSSERAAERSAPAVTEHRAGDLRRDGHPGTRTARAAADRALVPTGQRGVLPPPPAPSSLSPRAPPRVSTAALSPAEPRTAPGAAAARRRRPGESGQPGGMAGRGRRAPAAR